MRRLIRQIRKHQKQAEQRKLGRQRMRARRAGLIAGSVMSLAIATGGAANAATFTVANNSESGSGSLREAIAAANSTPGADTIDFDSSFDSPQTIDLTGGSGSMVIIESVTIEGPGADLLTIEGGGQDRIFFIGDGPEGGVEAAISGMELTGGHTPDGEGYGGAIVSLFADLTLDGVVITENVADGDPSTDVGEGDGGGVYCVGGKLALSNSEISGNVAGQPGDGIYSTTAVGGGLAAFGADVVISRSLISGNTAYIHNSAFGAYTGGGGVAARGGSLTLEKSTVSGNTAGNAGDNESTVGQGGGISAFDADLSIVESTISGNVAGNTGSATRVHGYGGGVVHSSGAFLMVNSTVSNNVAGDAAAAQSSTSGYANGGGLLLFALSDAKIEASTIVENAANGVNIGSGGGIFAEGGAAFKGLHNSIVAENSANDGPDLAGHLNIDYSLVENGTGYTVLNTPVMLINGPAGLGPLTDNGGPTETHAFADSSSAFNAGDPLDCPATDQRGVARPQLGGCDMGAFELAAPASGLLLKFEDYVAAGSLEGNGPGKSAKNRLNAMRNKLAMADALAAQGDTDGACDELASALLKTDGQTPPPDFVTGAAASLLAADIQQAQTDLGCE